MKNLQILGVMLFQIGDFGQQLIENKLQIIINLMILILNGIIQMLMKNRGIKILKNIIKKF